jgi:hypothetical protein
MKDVVVVAVVVVVADDEDMVEVGGLRPTQHQERYRRDHQQQYHQYLIQLKQKKCVDKRQEYYASNVKQSNTLLVKLLGIGNVMFTQHQ